MNHVSKVGSDYYESRRDYINHTLEATGNTIPQLPHAEHSILSRLRNRVVASFLTVAMSAAPALAQGEVADSSVNEDLQCEVVPVNPEAWESLSPREVQDLSIDSAVENANGPIEFVYVTIPANDTTPEENHNKAVRAGWTPDKQAHVQVPNPALGYAETTYIAVDRGDDDEQLHQNIIDALDALMPHLAEEPKLLIDRDVYDIMQWGYFSSEAQARGFFDSGSQATFSNNGLFENYDRELSQLDLTRLAGLSRTETAEAISQATIPDGTARASVIIGGIPDAGPAAPVAEEWDGPILITTANGLTKTTLGELDRVSNDDRRVFIMGGEAAVPAIVDEQLAELGYEVTRFAGATRYETADQAAGGAFPGNEGASDPVLVYVNPENDNMANVIAAGNYVARLDNGTPLRYVYGSTDPNSPEDVPINYDLETRLEGGRLGDEIVVSVGSTAVQATEAFRQRYADQLGSMRFLDIQAILSSAESPQGDPAEIAQQLASYCLPDMATPTEFSVANYGNGIVDALAVAGNSTILYTASDSLSAPTILHLMDLRTADSISGINILGGTAAVTETVENDIVRRLGVQSGGQAIE